MACGSRARIRPASTSFSAACCSPSALITLARRSRSASACLAIARIMLSLRSMCLISTLVTLMPQASVCWSSISWDVAVELVALGQHLIELVLAQHRAPHQQGQVRNLSHLDAVAGNEAVLATHAPALAL